MKHEGTTDREKDRLNMSVKTPASWKAHRVTSATENESGLTSIIFYIYFKHVYMYIYLFVKTWGCFLPCIQSIKLICFYFLLNSFITKILESLDVKVY